MNASYIEQCWGLVVVRRVASAHTDGRAGVAESFDGCRAEGAARSRHEHDPVGEIEQYRRRAVLRVSSGEVR